MYFPKRTERGFLEGPAGESERKDCSWTDFRQFVDDQPQQFIDFKDWVWHEEEEGEVSWRPVLRGRIV